MLFGPDLKENREMWIFHSAGFIWSTVNLFVALFIVKSVISKMTDLINHRFHQLHPFLLIHKHALTV